MGKLITSFSDIKKAFEDNKDAKRKTDGWLASLEEKKSTLKNIKRRLHQWGDLRLYTSKSLKNESLSLRYHGQEVAIAGIEGKEAFLTFSPKHQKSNNKDFFCPPFAEKINWRKDGHEFRKHFCRLSKIPESHKPHSKEHEIESELIRKMMSKSGNQKGVLRDYQPVTIAGLPLQFPVPSPARRGLLDLKSKGNIDVLARHGRGKGTKLSIWEIKADGKYKDGNSSALAQAWIYTALIVNLLKGENGNRWYQLFGFKKEVPKELKVEIVLFLSSDTIPQVLSDIAYNWKEITAKIIGVSIGLIVASYCRDSHNTLDWGNMNFQKIV